MSTILTGAPNNPGEASPGLLAALKRASFSAVGAGDTCLAVLKLGA